MLRHPDDHDPRGSATALVIGSGFGGLAAAVRLLARGYKVTVCEALDQPGGRARVFKQDGFVFDAGPTIITAPFLFEDLWSLFGERMADHVTLKALDPFYTIRLSNGHPFHYSGDRDAMRAEIAKVSPEDVDGYDRFMAYSEDLYRVGFEKLCHVPIDTLPRMMSIVPQLMRLGFHRSVYGAASKYFKHPDIRKVFSFHPLLIGGNPYTTTAIYAMISFLEKELGVHFAMGGTGVLVSELVALIRRHGGLVRYNSPVAQIRTEGRKAVGVTLESGEQIDADVVVSNADVATTYSKYLPEHLPKRWSPFRLAHSKFSMSLVVWYFGTNKQYADVPHHMILLGDRYRGLLKEIFQNAHLPEDFSLYLHRPTATDPSLAPQGCDSFYVLSPVPHRDGDIDWATALEPYRAKIAEYLEQSVLPGLRDHIVTSREITPVTFETDLRSHKGAAFSFAPSLLQSAWFRPHNRSETIEGLYLAGAGTHPGAGLPGVLSSARVLDKVIPDAATARA